MQQEKIVTSRYQEYHGAYSWPSYKVRCPICKKMTSDYGDVSETDDDGDEHYLCCKCVSKYCQEN